MTSVRVLPASAARFLHFMAIAIGAIAIWGMPSEATAQAEANSEAAKIIEGDVLSIAFPAAADLNTSQKVRRDGRISLPLVGEVVVSGLTPTELETALLALYDDQLVTKEVTVTVTASTYAFYVNGAVLRPGKQLSDRRLTPLEAIMEAGGPSPTANLKKVTVNRQVGEERVIHKLNLKDALAGKKKNVFYIEPSDIIDVPQKFVIF